MLAPCMENALWRTSLWGDLVLLYLGTSLCYCVLRLKCHICTCVPCGSQILICMVFSDPEVHSCLMVIGWTSFDFDSKYIYIYYRDPSKPHSNYLFLTFRGCLIWSRYSNCFNSWFWLSSNINPSTLQFCILLYLLKDHYTYILIRIRILILIQWNSYLVWVLYNSTYHTFTCTHIHT